LAHDRQGHQRPAVKNAVSYCADVAACVDSDGGRAGGIAGLTRRLANTTNTLAGNAAGR
jgi:hypothetical protein